MVGLTRFLYIRLLRAALLMKKPAVENYIAKKYCGEYKL